MDKLFAVSLFLVALVFLFSLASFDFEEYVESQISSEDPEALGLNRDVLVWGELVPGETKSQKIVLQNFKDVSCSLSFSCMNWDPPGVEEFIFLSWSYDQEILSPGEWIEVEITLNVSPLISEITFFNMDIVFSSWS